MGHYGSCLSFWYVNRKTNHFWLCSERERRASPGFSMFWVGLPHSSEVPPNKSPKSQCHTQHLIPCSLPSGDPLAPVRLIQRCSKHFTWPWVKPGWYLGGTWNILKLTPNMEWFQILKADYDLSYDRSQSSSLRCGQRGLACLLPLGFLAICVWVARLKDLKILKLKIHG